MSASPGALSEVDGFNSAGRKIYANFYDSSDTLVEQDGFDPTTGTRIIAIVHAAQGVTSTQYAVSGQETQSSQFDTSGNLVAQTTFAADGSSTALLYTQGALSSQTGFSAAGVMTYTNTFNTAGVLIEQVGYDASGVKNFENQYNSAGVLTEQSGYVHGVMVIDIVHGAQSTTTSYYSTAGLLQNRQVANTSGAVVSSLSYASDGSYTDAEFVAGQLSTLTGYSSNGAQSYENVYHYAGSALTELDGYGANGKQVFADQYSLSGGVSDQRSYVDGVLATDIAYGVSSTTTTTYSATGAVQSVTVTDTSGDVISSKTYGADGSFTQKDYTAGNLADIIGYDAHGAMTYENLYGAGGVLVEQEGFANGVLQIKIQDTAAGAPLETTFYDATGAVDSLIQYAADGSSVKTLYGSNGAPTSVESFCSAGVELADTVYAADGSYTVSTFSNGVLSGQDGFGANGAETYADTYYANGAYKTQTGYGSNGQALYHIDYAANGTSTVQVFNATGAVIETETRDNQANPIQEINYNAPGVAVQTFNFLGSSTLGAPTLNVSGLQSTFSSNFSNLSATTGGPLGWQTTMDWGVRSFNATTGEVEYYSDATTGVDPFSVNNGVLDIHAAPAAAGQVPTGSNSTWTSGVISTEGLFSQEYGVFEVSAKLPAGQGLWPAIWMLPADHAWPPELDMAEMLGQSPTTVYLSTHSDATGTITQTTNVATTADASAGFHTYAVDWEPTTITWYIDGVAVAQEATPADMHTAMYMMVDLAVGGWAGAVGANVTSADLQVAYVRAYATANTINATTVLQASPGNETLVGTAANNSFVTDGGDDVIVGGSGHNVVQLSASFASSALSMTSSGWSVATPTGVDTLGNVQTLNFSDDTVQLGTGRASVYNASGVLIQTDMFAGVGDATTIQFYGASGSVSLQDTYTAAGAKLTQTLYNSDGSSTVTTYDSLGYVSSQEGMSAAGVPLYENKYSDAGALIEQDGFDSSGNLQQVIKHMSGGIETIDTYQSGAPLTHYAYNSAGQVTVETNYLANGQSTTVDMSYNAGGGLINQTNYTVTGSYTSITYDGAGHILAQAGYSSAGIEIYANIYTGGVLSQQDGFDSAGDLVQVITPIAGGGSSTDLYTSAGVHTSHDIYNSAGGLLSADAYASDGSSTLTTYDGVGHMLGVAGYTSGGVETYANSYSTTGTLLEQDGFNAAGVKTLMIAHASDGSSTATHLDPTSGAVTAEDWYSAGGTHTLDLSVSGSSDTFTSYVAGLTMNGGPEADKFVGGFGNDTYVLGLSPGLDVIQGFVSGSGPTHDVVDISHTLVASYASLLADETIVNGSTVITFDSHDVLTLMGITPAHLTSADFAFI